MYFTEQGESLDTVLDSIKSRYGNTVQILNKRTIPKKGLSGLLGKETYEITGYYNEAQPSLQKSDNTPRNASALQTQKSLEALTKEIKKLHAKIDHTMRASTAPSEGTSYPELAVLRRLLQSNDFGSSYSEAIIKRAKRTFAIEQMQNQEFFYQKIVEWIAESITVGTWESIHNKQISILVGATGVGKTTTVAKVAKLLGFKDGNKRVSDVGILTIDNYRLAAKEQLDGYGRSLGTPVHLVMSTAELKEQIALHKSDAHILVDTIGRSPHEAQHIGSMHDLLRTCYPQAVVSLVVSATTKQKDLALIQRQYEPFNYQSIIITKLDETDAIGNVIGAFHDCRKPLVFFSNGQRVPKDIDVATKSALLLQLSGFNVDKEYIAQL